MKTYKIAVLPGDGIGPEVTREALKVLDALGNKYQIKFETKEAFIGGIAIDKFGVPLPAETIELCKNSDATLLGAVGGPAWDHLDGSIRPEKGLLGIRKELEVFANIRPAKIFKAMEALSPLKESVVSQGVDMVIIRELTGGIYFGSKGTKITDSGVKAAFDVEEYDYNEIERIAKVAFEIAAKRNKKVTSIDKANVLESSRLWRECVKNVSKNYPDISLTHMYVDNCAMQIVKNPGDFDVVLTNNIFGDILSDEAAIITGSIGLLPSASIGKGTNGIYEPIHGSAPDIAGKNIANPMAAILSLSMMMKYSFDLPNLSEVIESAVESVLQKGYRTKDLFENNGCTLLSTTEMGDAICKEITAS